MRPSNGIRKVEDAVLSTARNARSWISEFRRQVKLEAEAKRLAAAQRRFEEMSHDDRIAAMLDQVEIARRAKEIAAGRRPTGGFFK